MVVLPAYVALEGWLLQKRVAVVSPAGPDGPRRLAAAGAARVLVLGDCPATPGIEVFAGPLEPSRLPLRDASVDAVTILEGFDALAEAARRELLGEARRVLRRGGLVAVGCAADSAALWRAEDDLRAIFSHVAAFAELAWQGISFAPLLPAAPGSAPRASLRDGLLDAPLPARGYLLLASTESLEAPLGECVIVPLAPAGDPSQQITSPPPIEPIAPSAPAEPAEQIAPSAPEAAISPAEQIAPSVAPELGSPPDLDDLFAEAPAAISPGISPPVAPKFSPPVAAAPDPALLAELEQLREQARGFSGERDAMLQQAARLASDLERSREEKARTEAELHAARLRIEVLQHVPEDSRMHSLADLAQRSGLPAVGSPLAAHELVDEVAPLVAPEPARATADAALDRNRLREELARRTAELQELETRVLQQEEELRREHLENVRLVTDVDRLREQVERSRAIELERVQELERLGHELRKMEVAYAELSGLYNTQEQRLRAHLEGEADDGDPARARIDKLTAERDQLRSRERASAEIVRRRDRELADATRTIRELRRSVEDHASIAAELRGELAVLQVHVQRLEETVPTLQERLREQQRKTLDREEEAAELQRRLEEGVAEQEHLRGRLRRLKQELDAVASAKQGAEVELFRLRRELEAKHEAIEQLQQIVALGTGRSSHTADGPMSDAARTEVLRLRSTMAEQAADHAEALARSEAEHQRVVEGERIRLRRVRLETAIRAEEMEYLLFQLDTAEQRIWEMSDAEGRAAARLAAGLAQLEKQKEQYEDLADELEVTRNLLVAAQAKIAELERLLDNERARLARVSLVPASTNLGEGSGSFEVNVDEPEDDDIEEVEASPEPEVEDFVAPRIQRDPNEPDRLAGINFDDDGPDQESLAVRLAGRSDDETGEVDLTGLGSAEVSGPRFHLPSDDLDIPDDDDEDDELAPAPAQAPRVIVVPDEDDDDDEAFSIDTDWDEEETPAKPAGAPPPEREPSNGRIVIEVLEDEAWPEDEGAESKG